MSLLAIKFVEIRNLQKLYGTFISKALLLILIFFIVFHVYEFLKLNATMRSGLKDFGRRAIKFVVIRTLQKVYGTYFQSFATYIGFLYRIPLLRVF